MSFSIGNIQFLELKKLPLSVAVARVFPWWYVLASLAIGVTFGTVILIVIMFTVMHSAPTELIDFRLFWQDVAQKLFTLSLAILFATTFGYFARVHYNLKNGKFREYVVSTQDYTFEVLMSVTNEEERQGIIRFPSIREALADQMYISIDQRIRDAGKLEASLTSEQLESRAHALLLLANDSRLESIVPIEKLRDKARGIQAHLHLQIVRASATLDKLERITGPRVA